MKKDDYKEYVSSWSRNPNPSNQNFHNKLIRSLAINNEICVLSLRPFSKKLTGKKRLEKYKSEENNISWNYLTVQSNKLSRYARFYSDSLDVIKNLNIEDYIIISDTINPSCIHVATKLCKKYHRPLIGVCTDSPSNISGTRKSYTMYLLKKGKKCNGYIALTEELKELFNESGKPSLIFEGIVENNNDIKSKITAERPYFFFGGALLERYGIYELIEAFKSLKNKNYDLLIAGHSGDENKIKKAIQNTNNISYLGTLDVDSVLNFEKNAFCNVNPRPYTQDLDRFSIPSKTIEYLSSGVLTISVKNSKLQKYFLDDVIWSNSSKTQDLRDAINKAINMPLDEKMNIENSAKEKVFKRYICVINY